MQSCIPKNALQKAHNLKWLQKHPNCFRAPFGNKERDCFAPQLSFSLRFCVSPFPMRFHNLNQNAPGWQTLSDIEAFANPFAEVHLVEVRTPMRPESAAWTVIHRKAACVIAPITADGKLLLVRQERIPVRAAIWEFPAGQIDETGTPSDALTRQTALRELREECGYELAPGGKLIPQGLFFSSPGIMDEHSYLFVARPVVPSPNGSEHEATEAIAECRAFSPAEFRQMIASGEICDANTLASYARMTATGIL